MDIVLLRSRSSHSLSLEQHCSETYHKNGEQCLLTTKTAIPASFRSICKYRLSNFITSNNIYPHSQTYNQEDATFLKFIYFCKTPYMFQTVFPSIIRSSKLHIQRQVFVRPLLLPADSQYLSDRYCYLLIASICQTVTATCC